MPVTDPKTVKNRLHLDLTSSAQGPGPPYGRPAPASELLTIMLRTVASLPSNAYTSVTFNRGSRREAGESRWWDKVASSLQVRMGIPGP
jgi:hypothetical protein